jgi:hypothetical protein
MNTRARNVVRRPLRALLVSLAVFLVALLSLVALPRRVQRTVAVLAPDPSERRDTAPLLSSLSLEQTRLAVAESSLAAARERLLRPPPPAAPIESLPPDVIARRDSIAAASVALAQLITRAEQAPLPASYRALAETPAMRVDPRVRVLVDSLITVERERDTYDAFGGVDPNFVALTSRATEIGRAIQNIAETKRDALRREFAALAPAPLPVVARPVIDTIPRLARRDSLAQMVAARSQTLADARRANARYEQRAERARALANISAPPLALLAAALVLGLVAGFGSALLGEMRRPRVGDPRETERVAGVRTIAHILPYEPPPDRARRRADRDLPPLLETGAPAYRFLYLHLSGIAAGSPAVLVTGRDVNVVAVVAANLAALAALDARASVVVDAEPNGCVAGALRVRPAPGMAEIARDGLAWAEAAVAQTVGRDRSTDVIPAGARDASRDVIIAAIARELPRLTRRYDSVIVTAGAASLIDAPVLPLSRVVYCARAGVTSIATLRADVDALGDAGAHVTAIALWDRDEPHVPSREELEALADVGGAVPRELLLGEPVR